MYLVSIADVIVIVTTGEGGALPSAAAAWTGAERVVVLLALSSLALGTPGKLLQLEVLHHFSSLTRTAYAAFVAAAAVNVLQLCA
jgi:hypothetical protein